MAHTTSFVCGTPCETFSAARHIQPGPKPLRSIDYPYGLPEEMLTPRQIEQARLGTYFALQSANFLREAHGRGVGFAIEAPEPRQGVVSVFSLLELVTLASLEGGLDHVLRSVSLRRTFF